MSSCNCRSKSCIVCKDVELRRAQRKLEKYKQALDLIMDDSVIQEDYATGNSLYESVMVEKNNEGRMEKKQQSHLGESFLIMEKGKRIDHLSNKERGALQAQDDLKNSETARTYTQKGTYFYGITSVATKIAGFFLGFFNVSIKLLHLI